VSLTYHREYSLELSHDVSANTNASNPEQEEREIEDPVLLTGVVVGWPDGADNKAGPRLRDGQSKKLWPRDDPSEFVGGNDFTNEFPIREVMDEGENVVAEFANNDTNNSHYINVVVNVVELTPVTKSNVSGDLNDRPLTL